MKFASYDSVNGIFKFDHIERLIALTGDYIKRLLLYIRAVARPWRERRLPRAQVFRERKN